MVNITLTAIIVVAIMLVALAPLVWRRQKTEEPEAITGEQKKAFFAQWINRDCLGISSCCVYV